MVDEEYIIMVIVKKNLLMLSTTIIILLLRLLRWFIEGKMSFLELEPLTNYIWGDKIIKCNNCIVAIKDMGSYYNIATYSGYHILSSIQYISKVYKYEQSVSSISEVSRMTEKQYKDEEHRIVDEKFVSLGNVSVIIVDCITFYQVTTNDNGRVVSISYVDKTDEKLTQEQEDRVIEEALKLAEENI